MKINKQRLIQIIREELNEMGMGIGIPDKLPTGPADSPPVASMGNQQAARNLMLRQFIMDYAEEYDKQIPIGAAPNRLPRLFDYVDFREELFAKFPELENEDLPALFRKLKLVKDV